MENLDFYLVIVLKQRESLIFFKNVCISYVPMYIHGYVHKYVVGN
jgi:hypothetical protein